MHHRPSPGVLDSATKVQCAGHWDWLGTLEPGANLEPELHRSLHRVVTWEAELHPLVGGAAQGWCHGETQDGRLHEAPRTC